MDVLVHFTDDTVGWKQVARFTRVLLFIYYVVVRMTSYNVHSS